MLSLNRISSSLTSPGGHIGISNVSMVGTCCLSHSRVRDEGHSVLIHAVRDG